MVYVLFKNELIFMFFSGESLIFRRFFTLFGQAVYRLRFYYLLTLFLYMTFDQKLLGFSPETVKTME
jgi:hypothetical protein